MIKREENTTYIATISGGKDSVTMCDLLLKNGYPVDYMVFTDTFQEFKIMYDYIEKLKIYFKERYKKDIIILKPMSTFEEWCFGVIKDPLAEGYGAIRGIPNPADNESQCFHRRETKVKTINKWINEQEFIFEKASGYNGKVVKYVGYTKGEGRNIKDEKGLIHKYPLKHIFKMTEDDCKKYLLEQEMENPLYKFFSRTGCAMCPFQAERSMYQLYHNFRETWDYMKWIEQRLYHYEKMGFKVMNRFWFNEYKTMEQMEYKFNMEKATLFDFSDEPLKDCFCKI